MRKQFSTTILAAGLALALAFTFGCSDDKDSDDPTPNSNSSVTGGADGGGNNDAQVYNEDGSLFSGSGIIKMTSSGKLEDGLKIGSVTNGLIKLELLKNVPSEYLDLQNGTFGGVNVLTDSAENYLGVLTLGSYDDQGISYVYYSKPLKLVGNDENMVYDIDAKVGWNKSYYRLSANMQEFSTNNILTKEVKWVLN